MIAGDTPVHLFPSDELTEGGFRNIGRRLKFSQWYRENTWKPRSVFPGGVQK